MKKQVQRKRIVSYSCRKGNKKLAQSEKEPQGGVGTKVGVHDEHPN